MLNHSITPCDEPVSALGSLSVGGAFRYWRGHSRRRYLHTVYPLAEWAGHAHANVIFVMRTGDNRQVLWIGRVGQPGESEDLPELVTRMRRIGANEVHIHLLAGSDRARESVEADLRAAQPVVRLVK